MSSQLLEILNGVKTMSIVGMCKNAGKTTRDRSAFQA